MQDISLLVSCSVESLTVIGRHMLAQHDVTYCSGLNADIGGPHTDMNISDDRVSTASEFLVAVSVSFIQLLNARSQSAVDTTRVFIAQRSDFKPFLPCAVGLPQASLH